MLHWKKDIRMYIWMKLILLHSTPHYFNICFSFDNINNPHSTFFFASKSFWTHLSLKLNQFSFFYLQLYCGPKSDLGQIILKLRRILSCVKQDVWHQIDELLGPGSVKMCVDTELDRIDSLACKGECPLILSNLQFLPSVNLFLQFSVNLLEKTEKRRNNNTYFNYFTTI